MARVEEKSMGCNQSKGKRQGIRIISGDEEQLRINPRNLHNCWYQQKQGNDYKSQQESMQNIIMADNNNNNNINNNNNKTVGIMMVKEDNQDIRLNEQRSIIRAWHQQLQQQSQLTTFHQDHHNLLSHSHFLNMQGTTTTNINMQPESHAQYRCNSQAYATFESRKQEVEVGAGDEILEKMIGGRRSNESEVSLSLSLRPTTPLSVQKSINNLSSTNVSEISEQAISSYSSSTSWDEHVHHPLNLDLSISLCSN